MHAYLELRLKQLGSGAREVSRGRIDCMAERAGLRAVDDEQFLFQQRD